MDWSFGAATRTGTGSDRESSIKNKTKTTRNSMIRATRIEDGRASLTGPAKTRELEEVGNGSLKVGKSVILQGLMPVTACERCRLRKLGKKGHDMGERK